MKRESYCTILRNSADKVNSISNYCEVMNELLFKMNERAEAGYYSMCLQLCKLSSYESNELGVTEILSRLRKEGLYARDTKVDTRVAIRWDKNYLPTMKISRSGLEEILRSKDDTNKFYGNIRDAILNNYTDIEVLRKVPKGSSTSKEILDRLKNSLDYGYYDKFMVARYTSGEIRILGLKKDDRCLDIDFYDEKIDKLLESGSVDTYNLYYEL